MRDGALIGHRHVEHVLLGIERRLGDGQGHLSGLAHANADVALAVANDDESDEAHATTTLDGLRHAVDVNDALLELGGLALLLLITSHVLHTS